MKGKTIIIGNLNTVVEHWQPSVMLRWIKKEYRYTDLSGITCVKSERVLQQLHTSNLGNREWKDIEIEIQP